MKKILILITLLPSISFANELYLQCKWEHGDDDIFEYHYSKNDGLNLVKGYGDGLNNYKKEQCKINAENLVCKKHLSINDLKDEYDNKNPHHEIDHKTTINRFTLVLHYNYKEIKTVDRKPQPSKRWTSLSQEYVEDCRVLGEFHDTVKRLKGKCVQEDYIIPAKKGDVESIDYKRAFCVEVKAKL